MTTHAQPSDVTAPRGASSAPAVQSAERCFTLAWPQWRNLPAADGLVALLAPQTSPAWADEILARHERGSVVWAATGMNAEGYGRATCERPGVHAVALAAAGEDPARVGLALQVASHLTHTRRAGPAPQRPSLTSAAQPATPDDLIRIPHLVSARTVDHRITDEAVWELMTRAKARQWLGMPLPDRDFIEANLPGLLALRGAARTGRLPATAAGQRLAGLLRGRPLPLSIQLVYRNLDLFRVLLTSRGEPT